jgi:hypothetical protein
VISQGKLGASQADSAGSIPVTRSTLKTQARSLIVSPGLTGRGSSDTVRAVSGPLASGDQHVGRTVLVVAAPRLLGLDVCVDGVRVHADVNRLPQQITFTPI